MNKFYYILILLPLVILSSCGEKLDLSQFPITNGGTDTTFSDTTYVQQFPDFTGFNQPEDILVGREPLLYISDTKNNRVVQMDISGNQIGQLYFLNPRSIAQDRNFDLLVVADSVTSLNDTINIIYRVKLVPAGGIISNASKIALFSSDHPTPISSRRRKFSGISTYNDNSILISRIGPDNSSLIDPDNSIIRVVGINSFQQYEIITGFQTSGNGIYSIDKTSSIKTIANSNPDFIFTRNTEDFGFKVQWFVYDDVNGTFDPKFPPESNVDIVRLQLGTPQDVTLDNSSNVFVIDSQRDSLYKFSNSGRLRSESFGGSGSGENKFNNPKGVAWFNKVLYIADTGNNRIVRFKLSTDLN